METKTRIAKLVTRDHRSFVGYCDVPVQESGERGRWPAQIPADLLELPEVITLREASARSFVRTDDEDGLPVYAEASFDWASGFRLTCNLPLLPLGSRIRYEKAHEKWTGEIIRYDRTNGIDFYHVKAYFGGGVLTHSVRADQAEAVQS